MTTPIPGAMLGKGMEMHCCLQVGSCHLRRHKLADSPKYSWFIKNTSCLPSTKKLYPVQSLPTWSPIAFQESIEGVTTPTHASGTVVSIPLQCLLPWLGDGDLVVLGQPAARFVHNTDPSKLDEYGYCFFDKAIPLEMLDRVVAEVDTFMMDQWDPIFHRTRVYTEDLMPEIVEF